MPKKLQKELAAVRAALRKAKRELATLRVQIGIKRRENEALVADMAELSVVMAETIAINRERRELWRINTEYAQRIVDLEHRLGSRPA